MLTGYMLQHPNWLWALGLIPFVFLLRRWRRPTVWIVPFSTAWHPAELAVNFSRWPAALMAAGLALAAVALSRPVRSQTVFENRKTSFDIMLAIDLSESMAIRDYASGAARSSRFEAVKQVVKNFILHRPFDRVGIVVFAGQAYTLSPLTWNHERLLRQVEELKIGFIEDGTAIGDGLALAVDRLKRAVPAGARARAGYVVLLSDGKNNSGFISPQEASEFAAQQGYAVFTVAAAGDGRVESAETYADGEKVVYRLADGVADEPTLWLIASKTQGRFYRCRNAAVLEESFESIDRLNTKEVRKVVAVARQELFPWFLLPSLGCVVIVAMGSLAGRGRVPVPGRWRRR